LFLGESRQRRSEERWKRCATNSHKTRNTASAIQAQRELQRRGYSEIKYARTRRE